MLLLEPAGKGRILHPERNVVEMLLDGELADRGDASVVDLDFVGRLRRRNLQTNGNQGEREAGFVSEK